MLPRQSERTKAGKVMESAPQKEKSVRTTEAGRILKAMGVLSGATMVSRLLGLVRDGVAGALFGLGSGMDAFLVAYRIPNMLRALLAEGSLAVSFIPVFVEVEETSGRARADKLARVVITVLLLALVGITLVGLFFAPLLVKLTAFGFTRDPEKFALTVRLTRIVFPFIGFVSITAILGGILNARGVFLYPALAPVTLNVVIIASILALSGVVDPSIASIAWGVLLGGVAQLFMQVRPVAATGFRYRLDFDLKDRALGRVFTMFGPSVFGVAVYQLNLVVCTFIASWLPDGSVSYLYYAERLFQFPLGVFAVSVGVASLPSLSRLAAREEWTEFNHTISMSIRYLWFLVIPATDGLFVLSLPIVTLLFKHGLFTDGMAQATAEALRYYSPALLPVATTRVVAQGFYAMKDTVTPVKGALLALVVNIAVSLLLMEEMRHGGLALATTISAAVNSSYLSYAYWKRTGHLPFGALGLSALKILTASTVMAGAVWLLMGAAGNIATGGAGLLLLGAFVFGAVFLGIAVYGITAYLLGVEEARILADKIRAAAR